MSLMRWRDEMNWARQGRREKPKGEKGNEKKRQEDNCSRYLRDTLSRALKLFFLVLLLAFFF